VQAPLGFLQLLDLRNGSVFAQLQYLFYWSPSNSKFYKGGFELTSFLKKLAIISPKYSINKNSVSFKIRNLIFYDEITWDLRENRQPIGNKKNLSKSSPCAVGKAMRTRNILIRNCMIRKI
jgi:hypothetical protein